LRTLVLLALGAGLVAACGPKPDAAAPKPATPTPASAPADADAAPGGPGGFGGQRVFQPQTLDQMLERTFARFDRVDTNGDGKITQDEIEAARPAPRDDQAGANATAGDDRGRRGGRGFRGGGFGFGRADADGDGVITRAEVETQTRARFERQDTNGDGVVSADEIRARFAGRRGGPDGGEGPNG
jgi:hypothetical protein